MPHGASDDQLAHLEARRQHSPHERTPLRDTFFRVERALRSFPEVRFDRRGDERRAGGRPCRPDPSHMSTPTQAPPSTATDKMSVGGTLTRAIRPRLQDPKHYSQRRRWVLPTTSMVSIWSKVSFESAITFLQGSSARSRTSAQSCPSCARLSALPHRTHQAAPLR